MGSSDLLQRLVDEAQRFLRYGMVGVVVTAVLYVVYLGLLRADISPPTAAGICYVPGLLFSYVLNRKWTFDGGGRHKHDLPKFLLAYGLGFLSTVGVVATLVRFVSPELAQLLNIAFTPLVIYSALKFLQFGKARPAHA